MIDVQALSKKFGDNLVLSDISTNIQKGEVVAIKGRSAGEEIEKAAKVIRKLGGTQTSVVLVGEDLLEEPTTVVRIVVNKPQKIS